MTMEPVAPNQTLHLPRLRRRWQILFLQIIATTALIALLFRMTEVYGPCDDGFLEDGNMCLDLISVFQTLLENQRVGLVFRNRLSPRQMFNKNGTHRSDINLKNGGTTVGLFHLLGIQTRYVY